MSYQLPKLDYGFQAMEPHIDSMTMNVHYSKHHQAYVDKLNGGIKDGKLDGTGIKPDDMISILKADVPPVIHNNAGGHYNHALFWKCIAPIGKSNTKPFGKLQAAIDKDFGSYDEFKKRFTDAALTQFGSGWAWLGVTKEGKLQITSTSNQVSPMNEKLVNHQMIPFMTLDVWEHAYYLKYQNRRPEYVENWWNVTNWDNICQFYEEFASQGKPIIPF
jgi:superoxide dismutase, Fe-Mn family